jgi:hypothetical protein
LPGGVALLAMFIGLWMTSYWREDGIQVIFPRAARRVDLFSISGGGHIVVWNRDYLGVEPSGRGIYTKRLSQPRHLGWNGGDIVSLYDPRMADVAVWLHIGSLEVSTSSFIPLYIRLPWGWVVVPLAAILVCLHWRRWRSTGGRGFGVEPPAGAAMKAIVSGSSGEEQGPRT